MRTFRPVPGYECYEVSRDGAVRRVVGGQGAKLGRNLTPQWGRVTLTVSGRTHRRRVLDLVSSAFEVSIDDLLAKTNLPGERWLPVVGNEATHEVSNMGRVRRRGFAVGATVGRVLKGTIDRRWQRKGRVSVCLSRGARHRSNTRDLARLVCTAFHGMPERGWQANNKSGDTLDNRADNLEWMHKRDNLTHAWTTGLTKSPRGTDARRAKLTADQVREIRGLYGTLTGRELARRFGVSRNTVTRIQSHRTYQDVL